MVVPCNQPDFSPVQSEPAGIFEQIAEHFSRERRQFMERKAALKSESKAERANILPIAFG